MKNWYINESTYFFYSVLWHFFISLQNNTHYRQKRSCFEVPYVFVMDHAGLNVAPYGKGFSRERNEQERFERTKAPGDINLRFLTLNS